MPNYIVAPLDALVDKLESLPGIGHKTAQRLAYHILNMSESDARAFAEAIINAHEKIHYCKDCCNLTDGELCPVCRSDRRDRSLICVVEEPKDVISVILFIGQFPLAIWLNMSMGFGNAAMVAVQIPMCIIIGLIQGMKTDEIGNAFAGGVAGMGFIGFIIGFAGAIGMIMKNGMILDTIAYYASRPLAGLSKGFAAIGISAVVTLLNFFIPSASAKTAALMPIVKPMAETLGLTGQVAVQAFKIGDGMCNVISPFLGWTMGGIAVAKVPYDKWLKWAVPFVLVLLLLQWIILYYLTAIGWTGV